jgi:putative peptide zinc metalloprotease protein
MWPVFYVDISAAWRLPRWQRIIIDLGGFYFQMVLTLILYTVALLTRQAILLFPVIIAMDMSMLYNLNPMFKFDGYWLLSDIIGVPNLHRRIGKYLKEMLPWPRKRKMSSLLQTQPYAKITACLYALFSAIYLVYFSWMLIWIGPKIVSEYPRTVVYLGQQAWDSLLAMDIIRVLGNLLSIVFSSIMPLVLCLMLIRLLTPLLKALRRAMPSLRLRSSQEEKTSPSQASPKVDEKTKIR